MTSLQNKTILIAGGTGLIGLKLGKLLESKSFHVIYLSRSTKTHGSRYYHWDPEKKQVDETAIKLADVIINLAGEGIADKRWTARRKRKIINSRIFSTNLLVESLKVIPNKVQLIINASAIGIYGDTGDMIMNESSPFADDFLGQTCRRWELAAHEFEKQKIRTVIFRIGLVLAAEGGFLPQIKQPLRFGFAPYIGNGRQYQSWIHINDLCRMMMMAIENDSWNGTYNAVAPGPLSNKNFMKLLTHILGGRFLLVKIPKFLIRILLGEMSKLVTGGTRVSSKKIEAAGFSFSYPQANHALRDLLGK